MEFSWLDNLVQDWVLLLAFTDQLFNQLVAPRFFLNESLKFVFQNSLRFIHQQGSYFAHHKCFDRGKELEAANVRIDVGFIAPGMRFALIDTRFAILPLQNYLALLALEIHSVAATLVLDLPAAVIP